MKLDIIVPCYNEEDNIVYFYEQVCTVIREITGLLCEILFVDDGSTDQTLQVVRELSEKKKNVHYISFSRNFGKEAAMLAGLQWSTNDFISIMDVDLQDPPELLTEMLRILDNTPTVDCVAARRVGRKGEPPIRSFFASKFYKIMNKISSVQLIDGARDFRVMRKSVVNAILSLHEVSRFSKGLFEWVGFRTVWLEYHNIERQNGQSKWSLLKLFLYSLDGIISFSVIPLALSSLIGFILCLVAGIMVVYFVIQKIFIGIDIPGYAMMICIILLVGGVQMFCIGVVSQYLERIFLEAKHRPVFIIKESSDIKKIILHMERKE